MNNSLKEVAFALYCKTCKSKDLEGYKSPCNECLETPMREGTSVPENYVKNTQNDKHGTAAEAV